MDELRYLLRYLRREEIKRQYAQNTVCMILRALCPKLDRECYSDFAEELNGNLEKDTRTGGQILEDMIAKLEGRKTARESVHTGSDTEA